MASIKGTASKDVLVGTSIADSIEGLAGDDEIRGGSGNDTLRGDQNRSTDRALYKDWAKYYSDINAQPDDGNDLIYGEDGDDWISGGGGNDSIYGGAGNDQIRGDAGSDLIDGGSGTDTVTYRFDHDPNLKSVNVDFSSLKLNGISYFNDPKGGIDSLSNVDNLLVFGTEGNDYIVGSLELRNSINGSATGINGVDRFVGGNADDVFEDVCVAEGKGGNDWINGQWDGTNISESNSAIYSGNYSDYLCLRYDESNNNYSTNPTYFLLDMRGNSPDGYDQIININNLIFADGSTLKIDQLKNEFDWKINAPIVFSNFWQGKIVLGLNTDDILSATDSSEPIFALGGKGNDTVYGYSGNDTLHGNEGNDLIIPAGGFNVVSGGKGIDTVFLNELRRDFTINYKSYDYKIYSGLNEYDLNSKFSDKIINIERIKFKDGDLAIDFGGQNNPFSLSENNDNAAKVVKVISAIFGKQSLTNKSYVGIGLHFLDNGWSYDDLASLALDAAGAKTNDQIVTLLFTNVVGYIPSKADKAPFISLLENGMTSGALAHLAADSSIHLMSIKPLLVGLAQTGIEYIPFG
jgi:Ca2+-binding RTX toxin-like protein